jgi:chemotaxis methyl-accepting protein methylase
MGVVTSLLSSPLGRPVGAMIHRRVLARQERSQSLATSFFRNLRQIGVLEGPLADVAARRPLSVLVAGCSLGCEAYTLAGYLKHHLRHPDFAMTAVDIDPHAIDVARAGLYGDEHMPTGEILAAAAPIMQRMLTREGARWRVNDDIRAHVAFSIGNVLADDFASLGRFDIVLGQNFLIHMEDAMARRAFAALAARVNEGGAIFLGGVDLDLRATEAGRHGLRPVDWSIEALHEEDHVRRGGWPWNYWGLEPYDGSRPNAMRRYATIYRR